MIELPPELLAGILASPDDDAPRLAAADWYEEAGDGERAELIRVQCQIAAMEAKRQRIEGWQPRRPPGS